MKIKTILVGVASVAFAASGFAQGLITFQNNATSLITIAGPATSGNTVNATSATYGTKLQLFYQPGSVAQPAAITAGSGLGNWELVGNLSTVASNGRFSQSGLSTGVDVAPGGNAWLEVVAWSGSGASATTPYTSYATATADGTVYFGTSSVFSFATGGGGTPPGPANTIAGSYAGFTLIPVPEPTTDRKSVV